MRKLIVALVVLIGLLVAADFGLAAFAEYKVSKSIREQLKLNEDPDVRFNGFPFITQALAGDYREIEIHASRVPLNNDFRDLGLVLRLFHTKATLSDIASGKAKPTVERLEGELHIRANDLGRILEVPDLKIEQVPASSGDGAAPDPAVAKDKRQARVKLTGTKSIAGAKVEAAVTGLVVLQDTGIEITPQKIELDPSGTGVGVVRVPEAVQQQLLKEFEIKIEPGSLPFTVKPTEIEVQGGTFVIRGEATNVTLGGGSGQ
ncbi:hypothetical protein GCM10012275_49960 [Longimycelium tulufanense]|uniref:DUF2993 domain-containing protein n=1 Tax=Longimycelium tulufanense TaxID=907463 RepID=A0A8J3CGS8_9PSEU|nr:DUF2993 domain-containing protein [Longimycelium tulufanense]GGM73336.1 hypothetical protein GCM10012275_49960 [Longimycelium tulufanense]